MLEKFFQLVYTINMDKKILENILNNKLIKKGDRVGAAVSGGVDSMVLFNVLNSIKEKIGFELFVIHVNHNIRGEESDRDAEFVRMMAKKYGVQCIIKSVQVLDHAKDNKMTIEQSARVLRYQAIEESMQECKLNKVAIAHNLDDQAETVLMHMFRGSGLTGLAGMSFKSGYLIRPMLNCTKEEIENFAKDNSVGYVFDCTNKDTKYTRNYIRQEILPNIEKVYPAVKQNIFNLSKKVVENNEFISNQIPQDFLEIKQNIVVLKSDAANLDKFLIKQLIISAFKALNASVDVEEKHIDTIHKLLGAQVGKQLSMPNGVIVAKIYAGIEFLKRQETMLVSRNFKTEDAFETMLGEIVVKQVKLTKSIGGRIVLDVDKIPQTAVWRNIQPGDRFTKFSGGTKTLNGFLTDKKIDSAQRKRMVVLADSNNVLVVPGVEISSSVKIDKKTKQVVEICLVK